MSVNQAKVEPTSIARQMTIASALVSNALFVLLLFIVSFLLNNFKVAIKITDTIAV